LGSVIRLTPSHHAKIEEKPEVRKAGGVYYTPAYVVGYIVEHTVAAQIKGRSPAQLAGGKDGVPFRVLDVACGSGSFLLGAYQCLLDYCLNWYNEHKPENFKKAVYKDPRNGQWRLRIEEKKRILTTHIVGVDIDPQAVEVSKLSLLLKVLEGETDQSLSLSQLSFPDRALPNLANNIKRGNSPIGSDFSMISEDLVHVHAFDWNVGFKDALEAGGFDVIIGNPPYVRPHKMEAEVKEYFWRTLTTFVAKSDIYSCFMERALGLLRVKGLLGFIVPHTWTSLESFHAIRHKLISETAIVQLVQLPKKVFQDATVETCIFIVRKPANGPSPSHRIGVVRLDSDSRVSSVREFSQSDIPKGHLDNFQLYAGENISSFSARLRTITKPLGEFVEFVYGFKTGDDEKFIHPDARYKDSRPFIRSAAILRYEHEKPSEFVWYVPERMKAHRVTARPGEAARFEAEKILVARMGKKLIASYDSGGLYVKDAMLLLQKHHTKESLKYLLALINSRLLGYYYREFFVTIDVLKNALLDLPIRPIDFSKTADKARHDQLVGLADKMLGLTPKLRQARTESERQTLQNAVSATDKEIDQVVYDLYDLKAEEVALVEEATTNAYSVSV